MASKITVVLVGILAVALVAGMGYIVLRPESAAAHGGGGERTARAAERALERSNGNGFGQSVAEAARGGGGQGRNAAVLEAGRGGGRGQSNATGERLGRNANSPVEHEAGALETVRGVVIVSDSEILVRTGDGSEVLVGLGQAWYREQANFTVAVGDEVSVVGFHEDGEFKAVTVENLSTGASITLRDATGRPAWAGQGNRRNSQP